MKVKTKLISSLLFPPSATVLHGHVHRVRAVRRPLALLVRLLLEGSAADSVLDRRRHHPGHVGESCVLLRVPEHPLQRRLWWVSVLRLISCSLYFKLVIIIVVFFPPHSSRCCDLCWAALGTQKIFSPDPGPHRQSRLRHRQVRLQTYRHICLVNALTVIVIVNVVFQAQVGYHCAPAGSCRPPLPALLLRGGSAESDRCKCHQPPSSMFVLLQWHTDALTHIHL